MSSTEKRKRNRVKIEFLECGSTFDKDYRGKHELTQHGGEKVRIKHVGAPKNPFEAAIKRSKVQLSIETQTSNDHQTDFDEDIDDPPFKVVQSVTPELTEDYKQTLSEQSSDFDSKLNTENSGNTS